jgi:hypothetical protein
MTCQQDTINPRTHPDVMVLSRDKDPAHPFWYAHILGIFHTNVAYTGPANVNKDVKRMDFLWVQWFTHNHSQWQTSHCLHQVGFIAENDSATAAFGFLDLQDVVWAVHLIPAFSYQKTSSLLDHLQSVARDEGDSIDWKYYYVNQCVFSLRTTYINSYPSGLWTAIC